MVCKNCGKNFDGEKYYKICPKCGTYNKPDDDYNVNQYFVGFDNTDSGSEGNESGYVSSDSAQSHEDMHQRFDRKTTGEVHGYTESSDADMEHEKLHQQYDGKDTAEVHGHNSASVLENEMMYGHLSKSARQKAEKEAFEKKAREELARQRELRKQEAEYQQANEWNTEDEQTASEDENDWVDDEITRAEAQVFETHNDTEKDTSFAPDGDFSKTADNRTFIQRHKVGFWCFVICMLVFVVIGTVGGIVDKRAQNDNNTLNFKMVNREPGVAFWLDDFQLTVYHAWEVDTSAIVGFPEDEKLIGVDVEGCGDRYRGGEIDIYISYDGKFKQPLDGYSLSAILPTLGLDEDQVVNEYTFTSPYRYEDGPGYFLFMVDPDTTKIDFVIVQYADKEGFAPIIQKSHIVMNVQ